MDKALSAVLDKQSSYDEEFRIQHPKEETARVLHSLARLVSEKMVHPPELLGVVQDITERQMANEALRQSEEKFSKAFITSPYVITITLAEDGKFVDVNKAFTTITGFTYEEALADSWIGLAFGLTKMIA